MEELGFLLSYLGQQLEILQGFRADVLSCNTWQDYLGNWWPSAGHS